VEIADAQLNLQLGQVKSGGYIKKDGLERAIWLLGDLSGVEAKATLAPGSKTGTADLYLDILPKDKTISGDVGVDNYGNGYTGANELFTDMVIRNPFHLGDQLNLYGLITGGNGLNSGSITYDVPLLTDSGKLEMSYSHLHYLLGGVYDSLDANGIADTTSLAYKYTFHRSREANFYGQVGFAEKQLMDNVSGVPDNKASGEMFIGINGDSLDKWGGGGSNNYSLIATHGVLNFQSSVYQGVDAATTKSSGSFDRLNFTASRQQYINDRLTFVTLLSAQAADKNLDSSEQMILGGANGVRAYPQGEGAGDEGALLNCELRWSLPLQGKKDQLFQLVSFFDAGSTVLNKFQYAGSATPNVETLMGAGVGAVWNNPGVFTLRACYAWKVGYAPQVTDASAAGRVWVQGIYYY
jgi:hemolysin activation/secretion protein